MMKTLRIFLIAAALIGFGITTLFAQQYKVIEKSDK